MTAGNLRVVEKASCHLKEEKWNVNFCLYDSNFSPRPGAKSPCKFFLMIYDRYTITISITNKMCFFFFKYGNIFIGFE